MDPSLVESLAAHLRSGNSSPLADDAYERTAVLVLERDDAEPDRILVDSGATGLSVAPAPAQAPHDALVVSLSDHVAAAIGRGEQLLEDAFAEGTIRLDGVRPDDYRQAPVLETVLDGLVTVGAVR